MGRVTAPMARGAIKRALNGVLDRYPNAKIIDKLWEFFSEGCAYSGHELRREHRNGHADHLVATSAGGTNHPSNFVLACGRCNGDEKLDGDWESFLRQKCNGDEALFTARRDKILKWAKLQGGAPPKPDPAVRERIDAQIELAVEAFNAAQRDLLALRDGA